MIERKDVLSIPYLKKTTFSGSYQGMRYLLKMEKREEDNILTAVCWPEPYSFDATEEEKKSKAEFAFSEDGIREAIQWMNESWKTNQEIFAEAKENWHLREV